MSLVDQFNALDLAAIDDFITGLQEENISLDFKRINRADLSHTDDKKNLAKALSGFANSSGGIIVWGVDARKNADGIDCAAAKVEINPIALFVARLNEMTGRAVSPVLDGVIHKAIASTGDSGFAVTYVPESDSGPHMAKLGEERYYKRIGDSFYRMEHFDLEDMFGRRKGPKLVLSTWLTGERPNITIYLGIKNEGRGTAKAPYLAFQCPRPFRISMFELGSGQTGLPKLHNAGQELPYRIWCELRLCNTSRDRPRRDIYLVRNDSRRGRLSSW